jgi:hypothetical protein
MLEQRISIGPEPVAGPTFHERDGGVWWAAVADPARASSALAVALPAPAVAACPGAVAVELLVLGADEVLRAVDPEVGTFRDPATGLAGAVAVAVTLDRPARAAAVLGPGAITVVP